MIFLLPNVHKVPEKAGYTLFLKGVSPTVVRKLAGVNSYSHVLTLGQVKKVLRESLEAPAPVEEPAPRPAPEPKKRPPAPRAHAPAPKPVVPPPAPVVRPHPLAGVQVDREKLAALFLDAEAKIAKEGELQRRKTRALLELEAVRKRITVQVEALDAQLHEIGLMKQALADFKALLAQLPN